MEHLQYPIGHFSPKENYSTPEINQLIALMQKAPAQYEQLLDKRTEADLTKTYREGSWTVRQLVHHVADIQLLNFLRMKKALSEEGYEATLIQMNDWAATPDAKIAPVEDSLLILKGISERFAFLMKTLDEQTLSKTYYHPSRKIHLSLKQALYMAVWHILHHKGHMELALGLRPQPFNLG